MNCPNCDNPITKGHICSNCGADAYIYKNTISISDKWYNKGLAQAKESDLSAAIESLCKALSFNKSNMRARNLLGLVYFEYGRVGDALKHWIISVSYNKENNDARRYIDELQNDGRARERYEGSLVNYNQALRYLVQKSEDMAVIQLKKALEQNPRFVDALNLLAFCHLILKEKDKAAAAIEKVLAIDVNNSIALNYYREIYPNKARSEAIKLEPRREVFKPAKAVYQDVAEPKRNLYRTLHLGEILSFIVGGICVLGVLYILVIPGIISAKDQEITELNSTMQAMTDENALVLAAGEGKIKELEKDISTLEQTIGTQNDQITRLNKIQKVYAASNLQRANNLEDAADTLYMLDVTGLPVDVVELYDSMSADIFPKVSKNLYDRGVTHVNRKEYVEAAACLEKANMYAEPSASNASAIIYYLAYSLEMKEDTEAAKKYYEELIANYPRSNHLNAAKDRLSKLTG